MCAWALGTRSVVATGAGRLLLLTPFLSLCLTFTLCSSQTIPTLDYDSSRMALTEITVFAEPMSDGLPAEMESRSEIIGSNDSTMIDTTQRPVLLINFLPRYNHFARELRIEAEVVVDQVVLEDGAVGKVVAVTGGNAILDSDAAQAARQSKYAPICDVHGSPARARVRRWFHFDLSLLNYLGDEPREEWAFSYDGKQVLMPGADLRDSVYDDEHPAPDIERFHTAAAIPVLATKRARYSGFGVKDSVDAYGSRKIPKMPTMPQSALCSAVADLWLRKDGTVAGVNVVTSSGPPFDTLVAQVARGLRFTSARNEQGEVINLWLRCGFLGSANAGPEPPRQTPRSGFYIDR